MDEEGTYNNDDEYENNENQQDVALVYNDPIEPGELEPQDQQEIPGPDMQPRPIQRNQGIPLNQATEDPVVPDEGEISDISQMTKLTGVV